MRDGQGRSIEYLRVSVTDLCNCRCQYCMPAGGVPMLAHDQILSFEEIVEVVAACAELGVHKVRLTGGEPLVRRGIVDLVRMLADVPGIDELALTTNATLLAPLAAPLREAGLGRLNVSLDTLDSVRYELITRGGRLRDVLAGLEAAHDAGFSRTKLNAVLMGGVNDVDVRPLAELARDGAYGISSVRFIELMPMGECASWPSGRFVPADVVLDRVGELEFVGQDGVSQVFSAPDWKGTVGLIRPLSHKFCSGCTRLRLTADGMVKPCLHSGQEIPVRGLHGEELAHALRGAIAAKPAEHHLSAALGQVSESLRAMNEIGG
ncbi:molybdenum cofactor biosynthesis protein A [Olsenella sp. oral taxon 809 str. F0356]|uniref:GTP 3',8-cyclase MoaA n=1 Tax=Olsenella sp. oral taxon 809 TaxID=661086 RepID=UPI000231F293|nr:GTP 3',8-cyclase MoaA [Olsenella sp. oral taxon 809]EHF02528.1 molybdenum cofactor biosynthesis protein A [Olsenella sp. oral taxon 809 str. F0356]